MAPWNTKWLLSWCLVEMGVWSLHSSSFLTEHTARLYAWLLCMKVRSYDSISVSEMWELYTPFLCLFLQLFSSVFQYSVVWNGELPTKWHWKSHLSWWNHNKEKAWVPVSLNGGEWPHWATQTERAALEHLR